MTTTIETFLADIRYFSALDPYNWQVDNRPLSDLEESINTLASGLESSINSSKLNSLVAGLLHQTIVGGGKATGYVHQPSNMVWRLERSLTNGWITDDGKEVSVIAVQVSPQEFTFSAPSSGQKKLITISSEYALPNDSDLPYYDETQILETAVTGFNSLVCKVGSATFNVQTSTVALANPDNYPPTSPGQIPLFHIRIDAGDTTLNKVYFQNFTQEGQSIQYATTTYQGQVRFANSQEVIDRSTTTVVSPSTSASVAIDEMANIGLGNGLEALFKDRYFLGPSDDIDSIHTIPGSLMPWLGKRAWFSETTLGTLPFAAGGIIEGEITSVEEMSPGSGVYVVLSARQMATSFNGKLIATRTYQNPNWNSWTIFGSRAGDYSQTFKVATAVANDDAVRLEQVQGLWAYNSTSGYTPGTWGPSTISPIQPRSKASILLIGGGGGGGAMSVESGSATAGSSGGDTKLYVSTDPLAAPGSWLLLVTAQGGTGGPNAHYSNGSAYGSATRPPQVGSIIHDTNLARVVSYERLKYVDRYQGDNGSYIQPDAFSHPYLGHLLDANTGRGGAGVKYAAAASSAGSNGGCVEVEVTNPYGVLLYIKVEVGGLGAKGTGAGNYFVNGNDGYPGIAVISQRVP